MTKIPNQIERNSSRTINDQLLIRSYNPNDFEGLSSMVVAYYKEDQKTVFDPSQLFRTLSEFSLNPLKGRVEILESAQKIVGYAVLATFWSNEFGGTIVYLDELYIVPDMRGLGMGRLYIEELIAHPPYEAKAIQVEVTPQNKRARALYERLGFNTYPNTGLIHESHS